MPLYLFRLDKLFAGIFADILQNPSKKGRFMLLFLSLSRLLMCSFAHANNLIIMIFYG